MIFIAWDQIIFASDIRGSRFYVGSVVVFFDTIFSVNIDVIHFSRISCLKIDFFFRVGSTRIHKPLVWIKKVIQCGFHFIVLEKIFFFFFFFFFEYFSRLHLQICRPRKLKSAFDNVRTSFYLLILNYEKI